MGHFRASLIETIFAAVLISHIFNPIIRFVRMGSKGQSSIVFVFANVLLVFHFCTLLTKFSFSSKKIKIFAECFRCSREND